VSLPRAWNFQLREPQLLPIPGRPEIGVDIAQALPEVLAPLLAGPHAHAHPDKGFGKLGVGMIRIG
jgi:hypothetical protein